MCRLRTVASVAVTSGGKAVAAKEVAPNVIEFDAATGAAYTVAPR
jgi:hypothetical protein